MTGEILFFKYHAENETGRPLLFFKEALYEV